MVQFLSFPEQNRAYMKIYISAIYIVLSISLVNATHVNANIPEGKDNSSILYLQDQKTATLKSASRLFTDKNDLTSVILIIPSGVTVDVIDYDDTYMHIVYDNQEGYILSKHATLDMPQPKNESIKQQNQLVTTDNTARQIQPRQQREESRYTYLSNKYGPNVASRLYEGKIWKGMTAEMVRDSWGNPRKINRVINGNNIKEEWIYSNTWIFIQNDRLLEWGPIKK